MEETKEINQDFQENEEIDQNLAEAKRAHYKYLVIGNTLKFT